MRSHAASSFLCLIAAFATDRALQAQVGPGIPSITYPQNELFTIIGSLGSGNHGRAMMHQGYLGTLRTGGGLEFWDISNPYAPSLVNSISGMGLSEPHTYAVTTASGAEHLIVMRGSGLGGKGFGIWDISDVMQPRRIVTYDIPNVPGGYATGVFWISVQGPVVYCPVGSLGLIIVNTSDPARPLIKARIPKSALGGFNVVLAFAIGNTLVVSNSDGGPGFALLDISDPGSPVLVHSDATTPIPYRAQVNGGRFVVAAVSGCVNCGGGNNGSLHLYDIGQTSFPSVGTVALPSRGGSAEVQDDFVHVAASHAYVKFDTSQAGWPELGRTDNPRSGGDFDWVTPLGNLVALGDDQGGATNLVPHQAAPDTTGPVVTMVVPADQATDQALTSRVGVTFSDMVDTSSISTATFRVRPLGGQPLAGSFTNQLGIVNFSPAASLAPNTTYEVVILGGGIKDWAGNATPGFRSVFSTGSTIHIVRVAALPNPPALVGQRVTFQVSSSSGPGPLLYSWSFGDGTPATPFSTSSQASHTYTAPGHYSAQVTAMSGNTRGSAAFVQTVHRPLTAIRPTRSSTIALDATESLAWCVNADNDTVTAIDVRGLQRVTETPVGRHPRTVAIAADGAVWVVCEGDATVDVIDGSTFVWLTTIPLPSGSAPYGIAMSPDGRHAYVTLRAAGEVARLDAATRTLVDTVAVGPEPKGVAVSADSQRILVTRFVSAPVPASSTPVAEVYELSAAPFAPAATHHLALDPGPDAEDSGRGLPNYLSSLTVSPDGSRVWVPSKKDNIQRGMFRENEPLTFESTVRTIVSQIDMATGLEDLPARIDFNDRDMAFALEFSPLGDYAFVALQGSNSVDVYDAYTGALAAGVDDTGLAPQGLVMTADGRRLLVHNFMSRTVAGYDVSGVTGSTTFAIAPLGTVGTVENEQLTAEVLLGKQIFYNAADPRMNEDGYLSCATCHLDGGQDGRVWDFTGRGEGLRNTATLIGRAGMRHGRVHWTANFDEIQDFENDIRGAFGGDGFLTQAQWGSGTVADPLGQPKAGLSRELDALAAYVASLEVFGRSPHRQPNGALTPAAARGHGLFAGLGCADCHSGPGFTDSPFGLKHDVGTYTAGSGQFRGGPLTGFDTPTLRGLWATAPYLHDGSATTLTEVLDRRNQQGRHGATNALTPAEKTDLAAYLLSIDADEPGCFLPGTAEDLELSSAVDGSPNGHCVEEAFAGQSIYLRLDSPGGTLDGAIGGLIYQVYGPGDPPRPTFPGIHLDRIDAAAATAALPPNGFAVVVPVPAGAFGAILRVQGLAWSPSAHNGTYATTAAHDVFLRE